MPEQPIFSQLSPVSFVALAEMLEEILLQPGELLVTQGNRDSNLYLLAQGQVQVERRLPNGDLLKLVEVQAPAILGEMALLTAVPRRASILAKGQSIVWKLSPKVLKQAGVLKAELLESLSTLVKGRLLSNLFRHSPLLRGLKHPELALQGFELRSLPPGEVFPQGAPPPGLFLLLHGNAEVWLQDENRVAVLGEGDLFGEISLLTGRSTTAKLILPEGGVVLHLPAARYAQAQPLRPELEQLAEIRRGELVDLLLSPEEYEEVDEAWLVEEFLN